MSVKDNLYAQPLGDISTFKFDANVAEVFSDMIQRSVPGYNTMISAIGLLAGRFSRENSFCYDLGCSLGAASFAMQQQITAKNCSIVAVDNSEDMLQVFRSHLPANLQSNIQIVCNDICQIEIQQASVVVLNFTLQFIPLAQRNALMEKIYQGLLPGGILILSEKLAFSDPRQQDLHNDLHHLFKMAQGYSQLEISQKRCALEHVLVPETYNTHQQRLLAVGFNSVEVWFQYFNFASMIALK